MTRLLTSLFAAALLGVPAAAPASSKPCRDADGRVIACPKPVKPAPKRCKDATGRFVRCDAPAGKPHLHS